MLLLALALTAQGPDLPAGKEEAARICAAIELRVMATEPKLETFSRALHYNLLAARETRGSGRMLDNLPAEQKLVFARVREERDDLQLRDACRKRFPQAWATAVTLPQDAFDRATLCVGAAADIDALASALGGDAEPKRWHTLSERLLALPMMASNDEAHRRGINSTEMMKDHGDVLARAAFEQSGPLAIAQACEAAYPA